MGDKGDVTHIYAGIDNGHSGAIVVLGKGANIHSIAKTPIVTAGKANKKQFDLLTAADMIADLDQQGELFVALEKSSPMPRKLRGGNTSFTTAFVYGCWQGILTASRVRFIIVSAADWQNRFLRGVEGGDSKAQSVFAARRAQPRADWPKSKADMSAAADAYWLAEYSRRYWTGGASVEEE